MKLLHTHHSPWRYPTGKKKKRQLRSEIYKGNVGKVDIYNNSKCNYPYKYYTFVKKLFRRSMISRCSLSLESLILAIDSMISQKDFQNVSYLYSQYFECFDAITSDSTISQGKHPIFLSVLHKPDRVFLESVLLPVFARSPICWHPLDNMETKQLNCLLQLRSH